MFNFNSSHVIYLIKPPPSPLALTMPWVQHSVKFYFQYVTFASSFDSCQFPLAHLSETMAVEISRYRGSSVSETKQSAVYVIAQNGTLWLNNECVYVCIFCSRLPSQSGQVESDSQVIVPVLPQLIGCMCGR